MQKVSDEQMKAMFDKIMHVIQEGHMAPESAADLRDRMRDTLQNFLADQHGNVQAAARPYQSYHPKTNLLIAAQAIIDNAESIFKTLGDRSEEDGDTVTPDDIARVRRGLKAIKEMVAVMEGQVTKKNAYASAMLPARRARLRKLADMNDPDYHRENVRTCEKCKQEFDSNESGAEVNGKWYCCESCAGKSTQASIYKTKGEIPMLPKRAARLARLNRIG